MGIPAPINVSASGTPPAGDQANAVVTGSITAVGPTAPFAIYGAFNVEIMGVVVVTLTTTASSSAATVNSGTGLVSGQGIKSANVPRGTTAGVVAGTNVTLAFPPGHTNAEVVTGADAAAVFGPAAWVGSVALQRSFDGGSTYVTCGLGPTGTAGVFTDNASIVAVEPEKGVLYRINCTAYTSGTINYRISTSGLAAMAWGVR